MVSLDSTSRVMVFPVRVFTKICIFVFVCVFGFGFREEEGFDKQRLQRLRLLLFHLVPWTVLYRGRKRPFEPKKPNKEESCTWTQDLLGQELESGIPTSNRPIHLTYLLKALRDEIEGTNSCKPEVSPIQLNPQGSSIAFNTCDKESIGLFQQNLWPKWKLF